MESRGPSSDAMLRLKSVCVYSSQVQVIKCWMHVVVFGVSNISDGAGCIEVSTGVGGKDVGASRE